MIGIILLILLWPSIGWFLVHHAVRELCLIKAMRRLIAFIRQRIGTYHEPLPVIYRDFHDRDLEMSGILPMIREKGFYQTLLDGKDSLPFPAPVHEILAGYAAFLGKSLPDDQIRRCDDALSALDEWIADTGRRLPDQKRLILTLSFAASAMTLILLL